MNLRGRGSRFLARATRSDLVMFLAAILPPIFRPVSLKNSINSVNSVIDPNVLFFATPQA
jgi:hypothetical protein